ncbi:MAG: MBL fold metallo-hydrolase [Lachnospiraceae bacterium]|nr:MBL fold metallo-hydrolase [Lachnospiraceae bacterium]
MRIINLIENTEGRQGCAYAHGLSFYVETEKHKLLLDLGPTEETLENAKKLGIDMKQVDTVVLSHGHYDHSGGLIPFAKINPTAAIYMQQTAPGEYYADDGKDAPVRYRYIGIDKSIADLKQVRFVDGDLHIDDELELFVLEKRTHELPFTNKRIMVREGDTYRNDDFKHEHYLVVRGEGKNVLMSGCAHNGIVSIMDAYIEKFGAAPDLAISGFHLLKKSEYTENEVAEVKEIARELLTYPTKFVTCHCTGIPAYEMMKEIMGDQLDYVHSGEEIK